MVALALAVAGCHAQPDAGVKGDLIACANGQASLATTCTVEMAVAPEGQLITVHNPNGGFHRLLVTKDGRGVIAADGAEPARVTPIDANLVEVVIGGDRYRLPATVARR